MRLLLIFLALSFPALADEPTPALKHSGRGVSYFKSAFPCPLAGFGSRDGSECNRVALDDDASSVTIDRASQRIEFTNTKSYPSSTLVGDVQLLGEAITESGAKIPVFTHLKIKKSGKGFSASVHAHVPTFDKIKSAKIDPFEVVAGGKTLMKAAESEKAVLNPGLAAKLAKAVVTVKDNAVADGATIADLSLGLGAGKLTKMILRAELRSTGDRTQDLATFLKSGDWEIRATALSSLVPKDEIRRDLFLFGVEDLPGLAEVKKNGLKKGETLVFSMKNHIGKVGIGSATNELPNAADAARAFLEFDFLGQALAQKATAKLTAK